MTTTQTHFMVQARELLLDEQVTCPYHPLLTLEGVAVTPDGQHHLIGHAAGQRAYLGPTQAIVERRAQIIAAALARPDLAEPDSGRTELAWLIQYWLVQCWEALLDELVDALTTGDLTAP